MLNLPTSQQNQATPQSSLTASELAETQRATDVQISIPQGPFDSPGNPSEGAASSQKQARFLRKACVILFSSFFWTVLALEDPAIEARINNLLLVTCGYFVYTTFSNIFFCITQDLTRSNFEEQLLEVLEGFLTLCFLFVLLFLRERNESRYLLAGSAFVYLLLASLYAKKFPSERRKILKKLTLSIQISLVTAKILGLLTLNWKGIFIPLGLYLVAHQIYGSYRLIKSLIRFYKQVNNDELDFQWFIRNALQMSWLLFYNGLGSLVFVILISLCQQADNEQNEDFMTTGLTVTEYYSSFFLGYTLIFSKAAKDFGLDLNEEDVVSPTKSSLRAKALCVKAQKVSLISYFKKISPTYFSKIDVNGEAGEEEGLVGRSVKVEEDHQPCYICETNEADVILMGCGHGGVCKDCVLLSMKKSYNCMECRQPVQSIYQIEKEVENTRIVKAYEAYSIIL